MPRRLAADARETGGRRGGRRQILGHRGDPRKKAKKEEAWWSVRYGQRMWWCRNSFQWVLVPQPDGKGECLGKEKKSR